MARGRGLVVSAMVVSAWVCVGSAQVLGPKIETSPIPAGVDPFNLSFDDFKKYSSSKNFELLGHSYFKVPERTPWAKGQGRPGGEVGSGFNTVRVYDGIAYLGGYNSPPTLFGILIADVRDPQNMKPLSFIPCNPGTRCNYLRVNREKKILIFSHDADNGNPKQAARRAEGARPACRSTTCPTRASRRSSPSCRCAPNGKAHGLDADDRYVYGCWQFSTELNREGLQIIDYGDPRGHQAGRHLARAGAAEGRAVRAAQPQRSRRQAADHPVPRDRLLQRPPLRGLARRRHGDPRRQGSHQAEAARHLRLQSAVPRRQSRRRAHLGCRSSSRTGEHPDLVVHTDEIFDCPPGFGRILDVSDLKNPEVVKGERPANVVLLSTFRFDYVSDKFDPEKNDVRLRRRRPRRPLGHDDASARGSTSARRASSTSPGTTKACA